jgi:aryl-alcohol dehydrogenase-like predicted oxidoreductase
MKKRKLGHSTLEVSPLCFGGNVFGWTIDEATSFRLLDVFFEAGGNFIDTANVYSRWVPGHEGGESETILGKWMKARKNRDRLVIATKVGMEMGPDRKGLRKPYILEEAENSLRRLQTDQVDLYISHAEDKTTPIEETLAAYDQLIREGKARVCGASNYSPEGLQDSLEQSRRLGLPSYQSLQPLYNLYDREEFEETLRPVCQEYGLSVTPYYALASGFLTGKYRQESDFAKSPRGGKARSYLDEKGKRILASLDKAAEEHGTKPAVIALAWLMHQPTVTSAIASATSLEQLEDLLAATRFEKAPAL